MFSFIVILCLILLSVKHHHIVMELSLRIDDITYELSVDVRSLEIIILLHVMNHHPDIVLPSIGNVNSGCMSSCYQSKLSTLRSTDIL